MLIINQLCFHFASIYSITTGLESLVICVNPDQHETNNGNGILAYGLDPAKQSRKHSAHTLFHNFG